MRVNLYAGGLLQRFARLYGYQPMIEQFFASTQHTPGDVDGDFQSVGGEN